MPSPKACVSASIFAAAVRVAAIAGVPLCAAAAMADVKTVEPYFVVVTKDNVPMKAAAGNIYYPVRVLNTGEVVRIDGEDNGWLRAAYLPGTKAYVRVDEATFDEASKTVKLTRASKLMANNATAPRPWWPLLDADLPAGTTFAGAEPVKGPDNTAVEGYVIPAPSTARGYVRVEATRKATEEEVKAAGLASPAPAAAPATPAATPAPTPPAPAPSQPAAQPATQPTTQPSATPAAPAGDGMTMGTPPAQPAPSTPAPVPQTPAPAAPATSTPAAEPTPTPAPAATTPRRSPPPAAPAVPPVTSRVDDLQTLRGMFDRVITAGNEGEISTVISEFNRTIGNLGDSPIDNKIREALVQRRAALEARQKLFDLQRRLANNDTQIVEKTRQVKVAIEEAQKQAIYSIVGRMLPSTVYNGERGLPLMYRIESTDLSSTRTLGYVVPREGVELLTKMGKTVGIVGEAKLDPALGVNIVAPRRVDVLEIVGGRLQVITDTQTTTTTTNVGGQSSATSTTTTTTTTSGSIAPGGQPGTTPKPASDGDVNK